MNGWTWRKAVDGWWFDTETPNDRIFHAYDGNNRGACEPICLVASCEEPNEGSRFCPVCMEIVRTTEAPNDPTGQWA